MTVQRPNALSREDWVRGAFSVLEHFGHESVRVEPLAKRLRVTKGSFYWHFKNRAELLTEMLLVWEKNDVADVIEKIENTSDAPLVRLRKLVSRSLSDDMGSNFGIHQELAIRNWGRVEPNVAETIQSVDKRRIAYICSLLSELGLSKAQSRVRAHLLYTFIMGQGLYFHGDDLSSISARENRIAKLLTTPGLVSI